MSNPWKFERPMALAMWDFSWLERRWPGAGYEDWATELDGVVERGYDVLRIDAYPHLVAADPRREWTILPPWDQQDWGSPAKVRVQVMPALIEFMTLCAERGLRVGLSTWFQADTTQRRLTLASPRAHAGIWATTLKHIEDAGLLDTVLYVDLCNEWPYKPWAPFFPEKGEDWRTAASLAWMRESVEVLRESYPQLAISYSMTTHFERHQTTGVDVSFLDFLEPHLWMTKDTDFYGRIGYHYERFDPKPYQNVVDYAEDLYRSDPAYWQKEFAVMLDQVCEWARESAKPLVTTEGWSIVDYKDWPGLDWGWVKDLNAWTVEYVAATGCWAIICTSNFCGPQFRGMWRDVAWHQRLTKRIHAGALPECLT